MLTKEYLENYFKHHDKLVVYTNDNIKLTISKEYHLRLQGGHRDFPIYDMEDLEEYSSYYKFSLKPNKEETNNG